jgi:ParB/RepB/Spo0J family partition protein
MKNILVRAPLANIQGNPYQPRQTEDPEHIQNLAFSIAEQGLLQTPVGRLLDANSQPIGLENALFLAKRADGVSAETLDDLARELFDVLGCRVELAFGHSRLAAFRYLSEAGHAGFERIPVALRDLDAEELFRLAVTENIQRRDLTPIEEARAMLRYRTEFGKTSAEIGMLFGVNESTVRNKMRLVDLPETARAALNDGRLTENAARRLLSVKDVMDGKELDGLATRLAEGAFDTPNQVDNAVSYAVFHQKNAMLLYSKFASDKERAGDGHLFALDWVPFPDGGALKSGEYISDIDLGTVKNFLLEWKQIWKDEKALGIEFGNVQWQLLSEKVQPESINGNVGSKTMADAIMHLVRPPACSKCPFFLQIDGSAYCGRKVCFERKALFWKKLELERISLETGIAIYDPAADGEDFDKPTTWYQSEREEPWATWWAEKNTDLRLRIEPQPWGKHQYTDSYFVQVISVSEKSREAARKVREGRAEMDAHEDDFQERNRKERERREAANNWMQDQAALQFGKFIYGGLKPAVLTVLARSREINPEDELAEGYSEKDRTEYILGNLGMEFIDSLLEYTEVCQGPEAVAKYAAGVAVEMGMPVPPGWVKKQDDEPEVELVVPWDEKCPECGANVIAQANGEKMCSNFNCGWGLR